MIDINKHPVWKNISAFKKQGHLLRIFFARKYAKLIPASKFVGISGSVGKSSTTLACQAVLSQTMEIVSTTDTSKNNINLDPIFNIPLTILRVRPKTEKVLLEMGIEYRGEMDFYLSLVKPATAIITRVHFQHTEFLEDTNVIALEKGKLIEQLPANGLAILNYDDPLVRKMAGRTSAQVIFYGLDNKNCHIWASNIRIENYQTIFEINYGVERVEIRSQFLGIHQVYPLLAGAALGIANNLSLSKIKLGLEKLEPAQHRMQVLSGINDSIVIDDTYNAAPVSVEGAIETLEYVSARRRIVVLGEMRELGEHNEKMHRHIAQKLFKNKIDLVLLGTGDTKYIADELLKLGFSPDRMEANLPNQQIVNHLLKILNRGDVVLIKGARAVRLDEVVSRVAKAKK